MNVWRLPAVGPWSRWRGAVDALPRRARLLGFAIVAALLGALADAVVLEPALKVHRASVAAEQARQREIAAARSLLALPGAAGAADTPSRQRLTAELTALKAEAAALQALADRLSTTTDRPVDRTEEPVRDAADGRNGLPTLLARTLPKPAGPVLLSMSGTAPAGTAVAPRDAAPAAFSLRLRGRYAELQSHLAEMAQREGGATWPAWELDARSEPPVLLLLRQKEGTRP